MYQRIFSFRADGQASQAEVGLAFFAKKPRSDVCPSSCVQDSGHASERAPSLFFVYQAAVRTWLSLVVVVWLRSPKVNDWTLVPSTVARIPSTIVKAR